MNTRQRSGFTLIELLVVISIIAILLSIMAPSLKNAREQGKRAVCLTNLRGIGQSIYIYANNNDDTLVPGDSRVSWDAWGEVTEPSTCANPTPMGGFRQVNLGHLMASEEIIPLPTGSEHVFFCPSAKAPNGRKASEEFENQWGRNNGHAATSYMFNNSLDGFDSFVQGGDTAVLSHGDVIQYLLSDTSAHSFKNKPLIYDDSAGPERLQEVSARYGVCFPNKLLHEWFAGNRVEMAEARDFLDDPVGWTEREGTAAGEICLSNVSNTSLISDVVGVWGAPQTNPPKG